MAIIDVIFGRKIPEPTCLPQASASHPTPDQTAVLRFESVIGAAGDGAFTDVHLEAFDSLSPAQRSLMFDQLLEREHSQSDQGSAVESASTSRAVRQRHKSPRAAHSHPNAGLYLLAFAGYPFCPDPLHSSFGGIDPAGARATHCGLCTDPGSVGAGRRHPPQQMKEGSHE